jgi:hypothetical protein
MYNCINKELQLMYYDNGERNAIVIIPQEKQNA